MSYMIEKAFLEFGYTKEEFMEIRNSYAIASYTDETLLKKFIDINQFLLNNDYTKEEIKRMTISYPVIYSYSIENMQRKIENMILLGYKREEVLKMTDLYPEIYGLSIENMNQKIEDMISLGHTREEVLKMTVLLPTLFSVSIGNIKQKIEDMILLGYTREETIKMSKYFPAIYCYSIESMNQKINYIVSLGYTYEEVLEMTKSLPTIYGYSIETIKQKIDFYDSINMHQLVIMDPKILMQSVAVSYARYQFYLSKGIIIDMNNRSKLFVNNKYFEKTHGITKKELLEKYNYEAYMEEKNARTL